MESVVCCNIWGTDCQYYVHHAATSVGLSVKLVGVEIRSSRTEIRLDMIGVLLAKPTGTEFRNLQAQFYSDSQITKEKGLFGALNVSKSRI